MRPLHDVLKYVAPITGGDKNRIYGVARAIREANMIPTSGGPNRREKIGSEHLALLSIGWCLDSHIRDLPDEVVKRFNLPDEDGNILGDVIAKRIEAFKILRKDNPSRAEAAFIIATAKTRFDFDLDEARVTATVDLPNGTQVQTVYGPQDAPWLDTRINRSCSLSAKVIHDLAMLLHFGELPPRVARAA